MGRKKGERNTELEEGEPRREPRGNGGAPDEASLWNGGRSCNSFPKSTNAGKTHTKYIFLNTFFKNSEEAFIPHTHILI